MFCVALAPRSRLEVKKKPVIAMVYHRLQSSIKYLIHLCLLEFSALHNQLDESGCWVVIYNFIQIIKVHSVSKVCQCPIRRTLSLYGLYKQTILSLSVLA